MSERVLVVDGGVTLLTGTQAIGNGAEGVQVGGSNNITIGSVSGAANGEGLVVKGTATGTGLYDGVNAYGIVVGGQGGSVNLSGGVLVSGTVTGSAGQQLLTGTFNSKTHTKSTITTDRLNRAFAVETVFRESLIDTIQQLIRTLVKSPEFHEYADRRNAKPVQP